MDFLEDKAEKAEESGDLLLAFQLWSELAHRDRDPVFFTRYGRVAQKLERWDEAERAFAQALRLDSSFTLAMEGMGDLWATRTDKSDVESFEVARDWFLKALDDGRNARILTFLGATYRALGDNTAARDAFAEAVELDPNSAEALYNLAIVEEERDAQRSVELMEKAIEVDPGYFAAHQELGKLYQKAGDLPRAEYHFRRSLEIAPGDYWSLLYLANLLAVLGRNDEAERNYRLVASLHPDTKDGAEFFARFLESIGKKGEAAAVRGPKK